MPTRCLLLAVALAAVSLPLAAASKVERLAAIKDADVSATIANALEPNGYRLKLDDGFTCDLWLRRELPPGAKKEVEGALYPELSPSTLIAVVSFPKGATDFRAQSIKPGTYTLRYGLLPADGNHLGVAPHRDFLLLVPAKADTDPAMQLPSAQLVKLSAQAAGTSHPAVFALAPAEGSAPALGQTAEGYWAFSGKLKTGSGTELPFALIVKGAAAQ